MTRLRIWFRRHQMKLWLLTVAVGAILLLNVAAVNDGRYARDAQPRLWEYKTIWFRANAGDNMNELQQKFTDALNREGVNGWEYAGRCGHTDAKYWWVDYVVFKRARW